MSSIRGYHRGWRQGANLKLVVGWVAVCGVALSSCSSTRTASSAESFIVTTQKLTPPGVNLVVVEGYGGTQTNVSIGSVNPSDVTSSSCKQIFLADPGHGDVLGVSLVKGLTAPAKPRVFAAGLGSPAQVGFSPVGKTLFVSFTDREYVALLDPNSGVVERRIRFGSPERGLTIATNAGRDYVLATDLTSSTLAIVDPEMRSSLPREVALPNVKQGLGPIHSVQLGTTNEAAVLGSSSRELDVVNFADSKLVETVALRNASGVQSMDIADVNSHVVVVEDPADESLETIDIQTGSILKETRIPPRSDGIATTTDGATIAIGVGAALQQAGTARGNLVFYSSAGLREIGSVKVKGSPIFVSRNATGHCGK